MTRLEVFPPAARLKPGDEQPLVVRAHFSDGHAEDVTRWVKFSSNEGAVASVSEEGVAKVQGPGEAAISAWYLSKIVTARITSPFPNHIDAAAYARAPRANFIDGLVLTKLSELNIEPSPLSSDTEFIRRAYLDAAGILPAPDEIRAFLSDTRADKRARLIDALLERSEFVDYWAYKWSDLLLVSSRSLPSNAMWSYYNWIRSSVAANKPWDQMARELLTASGSTLANGAANYYVLHKNPIDVTENVAMTFMGFSITCARCHNHPLEKWTQKDYYQMANLFSRIAVKNGPDRGDLIVYPARTGEINHPRLNVPLAPRPLDGPALQVERRDGPPGVLRRLARVSGQRVLRARARQPRLEEFHGTRARRRGRRHSRRQPAVQPGALRGAHARFRRAPLRGQASRPDDHEFGDLPAVVRADRDQRRRSEVPLALHRRRLPAEVILDAISQVTGVARDVSQITRAGGRCSCRTRPSTGTS